MDKDFAARRQKGRETADKLQDACEADGNPLGWFDGLYKAADGDVAGVPWADCEPHPALAEWLAQNPASKNGAGLRAIDVGCGLGDNAMALQNAGFEVTAFDLSQTAIDWAKQRHKDTDAKDADAKDTDAKGASVNFQQADLFNLPAEWIGAFDFVHETYTIQALKGGLRAAAFAEIASLLKPGGKLLVICRGRPDSGTLTGPPWPVSRKELSNFEHAGLVSETFEKFDITDARAIPHFRVLYQTWEPPEWEQPL